MTTSTIRYRLRVVFEVALPSTYGTEVVIPYDSKVISESATHSDAAKSFDSVCEMFTSKHMTGSGQPFSAERALAALDRIMDIGDEQEQRESLEYLQRVMPGDFPTPETKDETM